MVDSSPSPVQKVDVRHDKNGRLNFSVSLPQVVQQTIQKDVYSYTTHIPRERPVICMRTMNNIRDKQYNIDGKTYQCRFLLR